MTFSLPPNERYPTPPTGKYPIPSTAESEKITPHIHASPGQTLTKTLKVFLDTNLAEMVDPSKKINRQVEKIPTINEILNWIVEHQEDIIREQSPEHVKDLESFFESITKIKDITQASSLVNFNLLDSLYSIAEKVGEFSHLTTLNLACNSSILSHCGELRIYYRFNGGMDTKYFINRNKRLLTCFAEKGI